MQKTVSIKCTKCNNNHSFYRYGKDNDGYQKHLCRNCNYQFAPDRPKVRPMQNYPRCPLCGKATFSPLRQLLVFATAPIRYL